MKHSISESILASSAQTGAVAAEVFSPNAELNTAIHHALALGFTPLPVAPAFPASEYPAKGNPAKPMFNGKNPSFIDSQGKPQPIWNWKAVKPINASLKRWFRDPSVKALGLVNNVEGLRWIDIDRKHFPAAEAFQSTVQRLSAHALISEETPGGWHGLIQFREDPLKTQGQLNIGFGDIAHVGEIPGFVVIAPSVRGTGEVYRRTGENPTAAAVANLEALGLIPSASAAKDKAPDPTPFPDIPRPATVEPGDPTGNPVELTDLASKKIQGRIYVALSGEFEGDRSREIVDIARELYGWENLARSQGITCDSADLLIESIASAMGIKDKVSRCLKPINRGTAEPALAAAKSKEDCIDRLRLKAGLNRAKPKNSLGEADSIFLTPEDNPGPIAVQYLYSEDYVRIGDSLHKWTGTYYEVRDERDEKARIRKLFERCIEIVTTAHGDTIEKRPYRKSAHVKDAFEWALMSVPFISESEVNPPGVNLLNGVLTFAFDAEGIPQPKLLEHSPDRVYTYPPQVAYHPEGDDTHALRLLEAIEPSYRPTVLRVLAAAFDLQEVRRRKGRAVRSMIFSGTGRNGKDSLRECLSYVYGQQGITSCTISDFHEYDHGKHNTIHELINSRINWPSENSVNHNIDQIQSLKQANTGDPLKNRKLYQDSQDFIPRCVMVFNCNDAPNLTATQEAIISRYVVVPFKRTFVPNPTRSNELQADPRFKDDPQWVRENVCPGLLNILIAEFQNIFREGIDYDPFAEAMEKNRLEVNHLWRFAVDYGLEEDPEGMVSTGDLWENLKGWYKLEGILREDNGREIFEDDVRAGDPWVRGSQQLKKRLSKLFPNIESYRNNTERGIKGIRFVSKVERALLDCDSWVTYGKIVELYGKESIDATWHRLPQEVKDRIVALQPEVVAEPPQEVAEPVQANDDEKDFDNEEDFKDSLEVVINGARENVPEILALFTDTYSKKQRERVWEHCPKDVRQRLHELIQEGNNGLS